VVYGCDGPWWANKKGLPGFLGTKLCHDTEVCATFRDVHKLEVEPHDRMLFSNPGVVGSGGNSGFQALNLVVQFGAKRIVLIGFDMHAGNGVHWYGPNNGRHMRNPTDFSFVHWRDAFARNAPKLKRMGVEVVNASADSALVCFEHLPLEEVLKKWD